MLVNISEVISTQSLISRLLSKKIKSEIKKSLKEQIVFHSDEIIRKMMEVVKDKITGKVTNKKNIRRMKGSATNPEYFQVLKDMFLYKVIEQAFQWNFGWNIIGLYEEYTEGKVIKTTLTVSNENMIDIALGNISPKEAFLKKRIYISSNLWFSNKPVSKL